MNIYISILLFFISEAIFSQGFSGPKASAMGGYSVIQLGEHGLFNNPAGLTKVEQISVVAAMEQRFLLKGLNHSALGIAIPSSSGTFGFRVQNYGFREYRKQLIGLVYARPLWQNIHLGASISYQQIRIPEYGARGFVHFSLGLNARLSDELFIGAHIVNPYRTNIVEKEEHPTEVSLGVLYIPSEKVSIGMELEKDIDFPVRIKFGFDYRAARGIFLRGGFSTDPSNISIGIGILLGENLIFDLSNQYNLELGLSPSGGLSYKFGN